MSTRIVIRDLCKKFGKTVAVDRIDLEVPAGSLFFLLGPSGCGKTTLLRMLAGFTDPDSGSIRFGDFDVTRLPANQRNCGMVFQSYALWPHMTVFENVAFGLRVRKVSGDDIRKRVDAALANVQMTPYAQRKTNELSGGQQQRVALARALVIEPTLLLLDEPLSNLDAKLRLEMRSQIRQVCKQANITAVYVTHDQKEALSMADGMAVLREGKVVQTGDPRALYDRPNSRFVADFLGETNFITAQVVGRDDGAALLETPLGKLRSTAFPESLPHGGNVTCSIRPETIHILRNAATGPTGNVFSARRGETMFLGEMAQHQFSLADDTRIKVFELNPRQPVGEQPMLQLAVDPRDVVILQD
ncbi:MAG: ABC transporter ATP-binding protein [Planctomycetes bacterium]|nr:ABC transporter ATP-binding protein [Planctomycetota bacterium]